jgi:glycosyl transferase family 11
MIIVKLMGGLGNQMFQYAAGRRLSLVRGVPLKLDLSWFANIPAGDTPRKFIVNMFPISASVASPLELSIFNGSERGIWGQFASILSLRKHAARRRYIEEVGICFNPTILDLYDDVYLCGYWQDERYFADIEKVLRREFSFGPLEDSMNRELAQQISSCESVALHVRRSDYVTNPTANARHGGVCGLEYYDAAMKEVAAQTRCPHYFIFSDDILWAQENLPSGCRMTYVGHNGPNKAHEDLCLMSMCHYQIIANSSFSWWGAWLNANPSKLVIAPATWYNGPNMDAGKHLPESWRRL